MSLLRLPNRNKIPADMLEENGLYPDFNSGDGEFQVTYKRANWITTALDSSGYTVSRAVVKGCSDSHFGDKWHLLRLLNEGHLSCEEFTPNGIGFMRGLCSHIKGYGYRIY
ncbi:hypothetical protein [Thiomicrorhabdus aquaedulcis]|uniref:hypothetical protein n=1 Tax=Thiomicrorhabdus aquaedulcis TaxID=2211106 RepID=UPI000FD75912|nr:hypothetical protein [Thiomicrorhabdus aquaedulcis]